MMKHAIFPLLLSFFFYLASCQPPNTPTPSDSSAVTYHNVSYGPHDRNKMDIRLAKDRSPSTPFVLLIHGGAWTSGDKSDIGAIADSLLNHGISSASINYRYASSTIHFEELMEDITLAIDKIVEKSEEWNIRNTNFGMFGHSAGAHMCLLYAYKFDSGNRVKAVISAAGPTDIDDVDFLNYTAIIGLLPQVQFMVGATYTFGMPVPARFTEASPADNPSDNPTLLLHGSADLVVAVEHSHRMKYILDDRGTVNKKVIVPDAGHDLGFGAESIRAMLLNEMITWFETYD